MSSKTIHYSKGLIGDPEKLEEYKTMVEKYQQGELKSLRHEWIVKPYISSVRTSRGNRVLLLDTEVEGEPYTFLLDGIGHKYHRSAFVVLKGYCERYLQ